MAQRCPCPLSIALARAPWRKRTPKGKGEKLRAYLQRLRDGVQVEAQALAEADAATKVWEEAVADADCHAARGTVLWQWHCELYMDLFAPLRVRSM